jgi:hypothetical protein
MFLYLSEFFIIDENVLLSVIAIPELLYYLGIYSLPIFTFGFGMYVYIRMHRYTREIKSIILSIACGLLVVAFVPSLISGLLLFFGISLEPVSFLTPIFSNALPLLGLILFTVTYLSDVNWLYRLPHDTFLLIVTTPSGLPIYKVEFKTRKNIQIEESLLSGMLTAINSVFSELFQVKNTEIDSISSKGIQILMKPGSQQKIVALVITEKTTYFLDKALQRYANTFEREFSRELEANILNTTVYARAIEFLNTIFPFFVVDNDLVGNITKKEIE